MIRDVILHTEAEAEIFQALAWYAERSAVAARAFIHRLHRFYEAICVICGLTYFLAVRLR